MNATNTSLNEVLQYENPAVVARFKKEFPAKTAVAEVIFKDLLRFFWASKQHEMAKAKNPDPALKFIFIMDEEMKEIDQIWHVFLLYTRDYMDFCQKYFGEYLHHQPDIVPLLEKGAVDTTTNFEVNLEKFLNYNLDVLGEDVIKRWFAISAA